jgi:CRP-like cAMP-binding protein
LVEKGKINLTIHGNKIIGERFEDSFFGEIQFFSGQPRNCSALVVESCKIFSIKRESFIELLEDFPEDKERFFN